MKPSETKLNVFIVDDDFMIARVHAKYIDAQSGYQVCGMAHNARDTLEGILHTCPDLLLLDVYLPDQSGLEVLSSIRKNKLPCDVILITAAREMNVVEEGLRLGIFDYLMKPFNLQRLSKALQKYSQFKSQLDRPGSIDQGTVDSLFQFRSTGNVQSPLTESGIDYRTLERVKASLRTAVHKCTAEDVAELAGVSRSTARTYLTYLVTEGVAYEELSYGTVGRPRRLFGMRK